MPTRSATARATASPEKRARSPNIRSTRERKEAPTPTQDRKAAKTASSGITPSAWLLLVTTYFAYVCIYCARKPFAVAKASIKTELSVSNQALGNIDTALLTTYAIGQLSLGSAVRLVGRKWTLVLAFALAGGFTAAFGLLDSPLSMVVAWGLAGLTAAPASPLFSTLVGESVPDSVRGTVIGIWSSCENLGGVVANAIAASVLAGSGWRAVFFVSGPVVAIWALFLLLVVPSDPPSTSTAAPSKSKSAAAAAAKTSSSSPSPLAVPGVAAAAFAYILTKCSRYCLMFWLRASLCSLLSLSLSRPWTKHTLLVLA